MTGANFAAKSCVFVAACLFAACAAGASPIVGLEDNRALWVDSETSHGDFDISRRTLIGAQADYDCSALGKNDCRAEDLCIFVDTVDAKGKPLRTCINADFECKDFDQRVCESGEFDGTCKFKNGVCKDAPPRCLDRDPRACKNAVVETNGVLVCKLKKKTKECMKIRVKGCEDVPFKSQCDDSSADLFNVKMGECEWTGNKCGDKKAGSTCDKFTEKDDCIKKTPKEGLICNWDGVNCNDATCSDIKRNGQCKKLETESLCKFNEVKERCKDP